MSASATRYFQRTAPLRCFTGFYTTLRRLYISQIIALPFHENGRVKVPETIFLTPVALTMSVTGVRNIVSGTVATSIYQTLHLPQSGLLECSPRPD